MALYIGITIWVFILLLLGLRPDSVEAAESWPNQPEGKAARFNKLVVSALVFATFLLLWYLTAFRSSAIGNDTEQYLKYFDIFIREVSSSRSFELGYQYLNYLIGRFTQDQHIFLIIIATIMYGGVGLFIRKYSRNPAVSICLFFAFFFSVFTSIFRQGIAMVIALYGYQLLKNGKKIPAALLFLLATTFHTSAFVCFLLFLDLKILEKRGFALGLTAFCAIISFSGLLRALVQAVLPRYLHYFDSQYASSGWAAITFYLLVYVILYFLVNKSIDYGSKGDKVVAANFTFLLVLTAFGYSVNLFERAGEYFLLIAVTEFPNMLYRGKAKNFRLWILLVCTVMLIFFLLVLQYRPGWNHLVPYELWH